MRKKQHIERDLNKQIQLIIDLARVVTIFDGTDRVSLEDLRNALFRLGKLKIEYEEAVEGD
jgi:hypothetical protein